MGKPRHPDDLADVVEPEAEQVSAIRKTTRCSGSASPMFEAAAGTAASAAVGRSVPSCRLRLAIAALDVFSERGDLFDRRREILGTARLLPGGGRRLRRRASRFLGHGCNLLGAADRLLHRRENSLGTGEDLLVADRDLVHIGLDDTKA